MSPPPPPGEGTKPHHCDISLPLYPGLHLGVILNYKWPLRFGNERSVLPTTDSSLSRAIFLLCRSRVFVWCSCWRVGSSVNVRTGEHINPTRLVKLMPRYQRRVNQLRINRQEADYFVEIRRECENDSRIDFLLTETFVQMLNSSK